MHTQSQFGGGTRAQRAFWAGGLCCLALITRAAHSDGPAASLFYGVDGNAPVNVVLPGVPHIASGNQVYSALWNSGDGSWNITCTITADFTVNPVSTLSGLVIIQNTSAQSHDFEFGVDVPLCPGIDGSSLVGGTCVLTLNTVGPGMATCTSNVPVVQAVADGVAVGSMFSCPFQIGTSGNGTATSFADFGTPVPSLAGPSTITSIGQREQFTVTAGDKVTISFAFTFKDTLPEVPVDCPFDLDEDGEVTALDLAVLLTHWGEEGFCGATLVGDLDQNGVVSSSDITWLMSKWGPCEN